MKTSVHKPPIIDNNSSIHSATKKPVSGQTHPRRTSRRSIFQAASKAWSYLSENLDRPFYLFGDFSDRESLRYAGADLMRSSCVNCHNTYPDTPKNDWKTGDVRGVLEVVLPLDRAAMQTRADLGGLFTLMTDLSIKGLLGWPS